MSYFAFKNNKILFNKNRVGIYLKNIVESLWFPRLMKIGVIINGVINFMDYLEYAWVTNPNSAGQSISSNSITTLTLTTRVQDDANLGSVGSNQLTLPAGTYYFEAFTKFRSSIDSRTPAILALYNVSDSTYVTRKGSNLGTAATLGYDGVEIDGQFTITSSKIFDLRLLVSPAGGTVTIDNGATTQTFSDSTTDADQRTTIKLWKK